MIRRRLLVLAVVVAAFAPAACADATGPRQSDPTTPPVCVADMQGSQICT
jgi:hypothetical protein